MNNVLAIINNVKNDDLLKEITLIRSLASVPIGGRYRIIDFVLSNMVNSGVKNIGILVQKKYGSLLDHIRSGKEWDLDRKRDGLFILPPPQSDSEYANNKGDLVYFHNNLDYIKRSSQDYVIIAGVNMVYNIDYNEILDYHLQKNADITILYKERADDDEDFNLCTMVKTSRDGRITDMESNPNRITNKKMSMETYIMKKSLLLDLIDKCVSRGEYDLIKDCMIKNLNKLNIYGYAYKGYVANINSIQSYFKHNMALLQPDVYNDLFKKSGVIYTKVKDTAPTKYMENANVDNSLIANECVVEGTVLNSVLFRGVRVHKNAIIKNSVVLEQCVIDENVKLENVILDKYVHVSKGKKLIGTTNYPVVIEKKAAI